MVSLTGATERQKQGTEMTTLQISTANTLRYNAEASADALAVVERIAFLAGSVLRAVRNTASADSVQALHALEPEGQR
jgi:hypothetical protein